MVEARRALPVLALGGLVAFAPLFGSGYLRGLIVLAGAYVVAVAGLALLVGHAGQLSLAQGAFVALGAYGYGILTATHRLPPPLAALLAVTAVTVVGWLVGRVLLRLQSHFFALGTLGFASIVLVLLLELGPWTGGPSGLAGIPGLLPAPLFRVPRDVVVCWLAWTLAGLALLAFDRLIRSEVGTALAAYRSSEVGAAAVGVDTRRLTSTVFALAAMLAAVSGVLQASYLSFISPAGFDVLLGIQLVVMVIVGGTASARGPVLGVVAVMTVVEVLRGVVPLIVPGVRGPVELIGLSLVLGLTLLLLPAGVTGRASSARQRRRAGEAPVGRPSDRRDGTDAVAIRGARTPLRIEGVGRRFGGVRAVEDVTFAVEPGEIVGLIGPNGAGKTTLVNLATGVDRPDVGRIRLGERDVTRRASFARALLGVGRTFQNLQLFGRLSVLDHLLLAGRRGSQPSTLRAIVGTGGRSSEAQARQRAEAALEAVGLGELQDRPAADLTPGQLRLLDLARALALDPAVLLLDEPLSGLDGGERETLLDLLRTLRERGLAILWIEHDVPAVMDVADRVVVLDQGRRIAEGPPAEVAADPNVVRAYLGTSADSVRSKGLPSSGEPLLTVDHLRVVRGPTLALRDASLAVDRGEIVAVLGPNGAGKSTLLGTLAGLHRASAGEVQLDGSAILGEPPERMVRRGVVLVPERRQVFEPLTVEENLILGSYATGTAFRLARSSPLVEERLASIFTLFPVLAERRTQLAGTLSGGEQQMLAIGRALMASPRLLMLDEPSLGLAPRIVAEIMRALADLRDAGTTILLVEQATQAALGLADRAYLLERGTIVLDGTADAVAADPRIARGYVGSPATGVTEERTP